MAYSIDFCRKVLEIKARIGLSFKKTVFLSRQQLAERQADAEVFGLFSHLLRIECEHVTPVQAAPPLITGPIFCTILDKIEEEQMEHSISCRAEALAKAVAAFTISKKTS